MIEFLGLHPSVFTWPLVVRLFRDGLIDDLDVIRIETLREGAKTSSLPIEHDLALMLSDQRGEVQELLASIGEATKLTDDEQAAYLWLRLSALRSQVAVIEGYQFYFEDLLDEYDHSGVYEDLRFFHPQKRGSRNMEAYLNRIDSCLERRRDEINIAAERRP